MRNVLTPLALVFVLSLSLIVPSVSAQEAISATAVSRGDAQHPPCETRIAPIHILAVAAKPTTPYSATEENSSVQTLADGTHIIHKPRLVKVYRDSLGRSRREQNLCGPNAADNPDAVYIIIRDPVEGVAYVLDIQNHIAHRFTAEVRAPLASSATPPPATNGKVQTVVTGGMGTGAPSGTIGVTISSSGAAPSFDAHYQRNVETQPLGTQVIEGLPVVGERTIRTIPVDAEGNDRPMQIVIESWHSTDLKVPVLTKTTDPRSGENTFRLIDVSRSEPDPALFRPPADFKIVDDTETVTIQYSR